jgi:hypothetical protein
MLVANFMTNRAILAMDSNRRIEAGFSTKDNEANKGGNPLFASVASKPSSLHGTCATLQP